MSAIRMEYPLCGHWAMWGVMPEGMGEYKIERCPKCETGILSEQEEWHRAHGYFGDLGPSTPIKMFKSISFCNVAIQYPCRIIWQSTKKQELVIIYAAYSLPVSLETVGLLTIDWIDEDAMHSRWTFPALLYISKTFVLGREKMPASWAHRFVGKIKE